MSLQGSRLIKLLGSIQSFAKGNLEWDGCVIVKGGLLFKGQECAKLRIP